MKNCSIFFKDEKSRMFFKNYFLKPSFLFFALLLFPHFSKSHLGDYTDTASAHAGYGGHNASSTNNNGKYHEHYDCHELPYGAGGHSSTGCYGEGQTFTINGKKHTIQREPGTTPLSCRKCFHVHTVEASCPEGSVQVNEVQPLFGAITINKPTTSNTEATTTINAAPVGATQTTAYTLRWWCGEAHQLPTAHRQGLSWRASDHFKYSDSNGGPSGFQGQKARMCSLLIPKTLRDTIMLPRASFTGAVNGDHFRIWASCPPSSGTDKEEDCKTIIRDFINGTHTLKPGAASMGELSNCCNRDREPAGCKKWIEKTRNRRCWAPLWDNVNNHWSGGSASDTGATPPGKGAYSSQSPYKFVNILARKRGQIVGSGGVLQNMQLLSNGMRRSVKCECYSGYKFDFKDRETEYCCHCPGETQDPNTGVCCPSGTTLSSDGQSCECDNGPYKFSVTEKDCDKRTCTCPYPPYVKPANGDCCAAGGVGRPCKACPLLAPNAGCYTGATKVTTTPSDPTESICTCTGNGVSTDAEGNCLKDCTATPGKTLTGIRFVLPGASVDLTRISGNCKTITSGPHNGKCAYLLRCASDSGDPDDDVDCKEVVDQGGGNQYRTIPGINLLVDNINNLPLELPSAEQGFSNRTSRCPASAGNKACIGFLDQQQLAARCICPTTGNWRASSVDGKCQASCSDEGTTNPPGTPVTQCECTNGDYTYTHNHTCVKTEGTACLDEKVRCQCPDGSPRPEDGICKCCGGNPMDMKLCTGSRCPGGCTKPCPDGGTECCRGICPCKCPNGEDCTDSDGPLGPAPADCCCGDGSACPSGNSALCPPPCPTPPCNPDDINMGDYNRSDLVFGNSALGQSFRSVYSLGRADRPDYVCWECTDRPDSPTPSLDVDCVSLSSANSYAERQRRDLYCPIIGACETDGKGRCKCLNSDGTTKDNSYCEYANQDPFRRKSVSGETSGASATQGQRLQIESTRTMTVIPPN